MSIPVTIIDYGSGNIFSVTRALEHCGAAPLLSVNPDDIERAERIVLPGVGAFAAGMEGLRERGLVEPIRRYARSGRPLLGICLGMQMLASTSDEFGEYEGLDIIPGRVRAVPNVDLNGTPQKIPHIGWAELAAPAPARWAQTILENIAEGEAVYLVHSYHLVPDDPAHRLADCLYGGHRLAAAVQAGNVSGCQYHPEKSGEVGLRQLSAFLRQ